MDSINVRGLKDLGFKLMHSKADQDGQTIRFQALLRKMDFPAVSAE